MSGGDGNPLGLSDEDFLKLNEPDGAGLTDGSNEDPAAAGDPNAVVSGSDEGANTPSSSTEAGSEAGTADEGGAADPTDSGAGEAAANGAVDPSTNPEAKKDGEGETASTDQEAKNSDGKPKEGEADKAPDYKAFYEQIMTPFKANGKMIELRSPDEAISLMQMGANYTRKMQELQPHRKTLLMLQNNDLLDPAKLSFLIDLDKGDIEAVKKFIKDRGIDPLDIDTSTDPAYLGGNHQVTDEEAAFRTVLEEVSSSDTGKQTLQEINGRWDTASKDMLWKNPEILTTIQEQRENGVYAAITGEMERLQTLGKLRADMPFLEAYKTVGDLMLAEASKGQPQLDAGTADQGQPAARQVVATRAATPQSPVNNDDRAAAASPSRGTATQPKGFINPLAMSDDEFLKQMENRV